MERLVFKVDTDLLEKDYECILAEFTPTLNAFKAENGIETNIKSIELFPYDGDNLVQNKVTVVVSFYEIGEEDDNVNVSISGTLNLP